MTSTFSAKITGKRSRTFTSVLGGTLDFMLPTLQTFGLTISASDSGSVAANTGFSHTLSDSDSLTETLFGDLSTFIGAGSFNLGVLALATSQFAASGNVNSSVETQAYASAQVTYDYSPQRRSVRLAVPQQAVPEPGSLLLVALALGAAAMSRRRA